MAWQISPAADKRLQELRSSFRVSHSQHTVNIELIDNATGECYFKHQSPAGTSESSALDAACLEVTDDKRPRSIGTKISEQQEAIAAKDAEIAALRAKLEKLGGKVDDEPPVAEKKGKKVRKITIDGEPLGDDDE